MSYVNEFQEQFRALNPHSSFGKYVRDIQSQSHLGSAFSHFKSAEHTYEKISRWFQSQSSAPKQFQEIFERSEVLSQAYKLASTLNFVGQLSSSHESIQRMTRQLGADSASARMAQSLIPLVKQDLFQKYENLFSTGSVARQLAISEASVAHLHSANQRLLEHWHSLNEVDFSKLVVDEADLQTAEEAAQYVSENVAKDGALHDTVQMMTEVIAAQPNPGVQLMLLVCFKKLLDWLLAGAIGAAMGHYAPLVLGDSPREDKKIVNSTALEVIGSPVLLNGYRFVSSKVLVVRLNPGAKSPELGRLHYGAAVELLEKSGHFALVKWRDGESKVELQGWVFARYLSKFK